MNDISHRQPDDQPAVSQGKAKTWPHGVPALRLTRRAPVAAAVAALQENAGVPALDAPPRLLRLRRLVSGLVLLSIAWLCLLLVAFLGMHAWDSLSHQKVSLHLLLYVLEAVGACWVGIAALACILTGAFCLALALTTSKW